MSDEPTPGQRFNVVREKAGLSRQQLADALGVTYQRIANIENGQREPSLDWLYEAARVLGCRPFDLDERLTKDRPKKNEK